LLFVSGDGVVGEGGSCDRVGVKGKLVSSAKGFVDAPSAPPAGSVVVVLITSGPSPLVVVVVTGGPVPFVVVGASTAVLFEETLKNEELPLCVADKADCLPFEASVVAEPIPASFLSTDGSRSLPLSFFEVPNDNIDAFFIKDGLGVGVSAELEELYLS